jgi:membrane-bound lytic murein transglycosylase B
MAAGREVERDDLTRKPQPPSQEPVSWDIYRAAAKGKLLGTVEAADEREAIEKAAEQFNVPATKLNAVRRQ